MNTVNDAGTAEQIVITVSPSTFAELDALLDDIGLKCCLFGDGLITQVIDLGRVLLISETEAVC